MRFVTRTVVLIFSIVLSTIVFSSICFAAKYVEEGLQAIPFVNGGKITGVKVILKAANGGSKINILQLNYPGSTILATSASLTAKKGFYKIELLEADKPTLILTSRGGKTVKGDGRLSVNAGGAVQYRVTAKKAKNIVLNLSFSPLVTKDGSRISRTSNEEKKSARREDGLSLKLTCVAGKNCLLQVQNMSSSKAYRNISFRIDYKMMVKEGTIGKSKSGSIGDALLPDKAGEWPIALVFGEPPRDIGVSLIKAEAVDPAEIKVQTADQPKNSVIPLLSLKEVEGKGIKHPPL